MIIRSYIIVLQQAVTINTVAHLCRARQAKLEIVAKTASSTTLSNVPKTCSVLSSHSLFYLQIYVRTRYMHARTHTRNYSEKNWHNAKVHQNIRLMCGTKTYHKPTYSARSSQQKANKHLGCGPRCVTCLVAYKTSGTSWEFVSNRSLL